jgi:glyoxylase-like metal-dependent hydrolase (beta-lactamase superfamily II)
MKEVADGVWHLNTFFFPNGVNAFLAGDVLIDAGTRRSGKGILRDLDGHEVNAHALTHAHPDHQGASHDVCERLGIPFWVGDGDVAAAENPDLIRERQPDHPIARIFVKAMTGPGHPVDRRLAEGDEVAGFTVLFTPGHSAGHIALWRERDGVLILGDVLNNQHPLLGFPRGLRLPLDVFTPDPALNRQSARRLGGLPARTVLFGHGPPERDGGRFRAFTTGL